MLVQRTFEGTFETFYSHLLSQTIFKGNDKSQVGLISLTVYVGPRDHWAPC